MEPQAAAHMLQDVATPDRTGERAHQRLAEVRDVLGDDLAAVEEGLASLVKSGLVPATDATEHLRAAGGKRVRPMLVLLSAAAFGEVPKSARDIAIACELVHLATLLHDDVIDDGDTRRGAVVSRRVYGNAVSVLAGDLLLTHALERTAHAAPALLPSLIKTLRALVDGEVVQLRGRVHLDPSPETYFQIVRDKTASLFSWAARAGATLGGANERGADAMRRFGEHVGVAFQLVDDTLDFSGDPHVTGKALFADVAEGKLTLPLLLVLEKEPALARDLSLVRGGDESAARNIAARVRASTAIAETRARAAVHTSEALRALSEIPESAYRDLLSLVGKELVSRAA